VGDSVSITAHPEAGEFHTCRRVSNELNVKCMKLTRGKIMRTLLCGFVRMCGGFNFLTTAHPEAGEFHTCRRVSNELNVKCMKSITRKFM